MKTKSKIKYGKTNLLPKAIDRKDVRVMISLRMPADLLDQYRVIAEERGIPYQTLIQQVLREYSGNNEPIQKRLEKLEEEIQRIKKRAG